MFNSTTKRYAGISMFLVLILAGSCYANWYYKAYSFKMFNEGLQFNAAIIFNNYMNDRDLHEVPTTEAFTHYLLDKHPLDFIEFNFSRWHLSLLTEGDSVVLYHHGFDGMDDHVQPRLLPNQYSFLDFYLNKKGDIFLAKVPLDQH
jgi:hypothetical protein